ncbi:MAG: FAD:protein FMN transferase [Spirochaetaceae bacterium]|jgi:thiamine biosynthesis lipoprotein|nr:FAD:protein FMN transferase [Spirochaetaceae bacterium]
MIFGTGSKRVLWSLLAGLCVLTQGCAKPPPSQTEYVLGTVCSVNLYGRGSARLYRNIFSRLREIEGRMSANIEDTELERINAQAGIAPVKVHEDLVEVLLRARYFAEISGGAFDPTIGPIVKLWNIGFDGARLPSQEEIDRALPLVNWRELVIDQDAGTVFLARPGMRLDIGGIAKGYAADEAVRLIRKAGIPRAIVDLGGNIFALGEKEGNLPWRVGIQNPSGLRNDYLGILEVRNKTIVTSGVYERFLELDGKTYHHILSSRDGYPVENGLVSVTIIAGRSIDADGLSTGIFAMGYERGRQRIESLDDAEALFVFADNTIRGTAGALENFTLTDTAYSFGD